MAEQRYECESEIKLLNQDEVKYIWGFIKTQYSSKIFAIINEHLDSGVKINKDNLLNYVKTDHLALNIADLFIKDKDKEEKLKHIQNLFDIYINEYASLFLQTNEPTRSRLDMMMDKQLEIIINKYPTMDDVTQQDSDSLVRLSSSEKKSILKIIHGQLAHSLLSAMALNVRKTAGNIMFEDLCDASPDILDVYKNLIIFNEINDLRKKKELVRSLIQDYAYDMLSGLQMRDKEKLEEIFTKAKKAIGSTLLNQILEKIKVSDSYPTTLELLDTDNNEVRKSVRAIDIYMHLPEYISNTAFVRNIINAINIAIENLSKPKVSSDKSEKTETKEKKHEESVPNFSNSYQQQKSKSTPPIFGFNDLFTSVNGQQVKMNEYKKIMEKYKDNIITLNQKSNSNLFYHIAQRSSLDVINSSLAQTPNIHAVKDQFGNSALHLAALVGYASVVKLLLSKNFVYDEKNNRGDTSLHLAILGGSEEVVSMLVDEGANVHTSNNDNYDAFLLSMNINDKNSHIPTILMKSHTFNMGKTY